MLSPFLLPRTLILLCPLFGGLALGQEVDPLTPAERAWLAEHPVIRAAPTPDYHPTEFIDDRGMYSGITAEYLRLIEERLGIEFTLVQPTAEERLLQVPDAIGADLIPLSAPTPSREEHWVFTSPYLSYPAAIIGTRATAELGMDDLAGRRVAVVQGYAAAEFVATEFPAIELVAARDTTDALRRVSTGDCVALISDLPVASWFVERDGISNLVVAGESGYTYDMGFSVRKDWPELRDILEKGLATITREEREAFYRKWVHLSVLAPRLPVAWKYVLGAFGLALVLAAAVIAWNHALKRQIAERTRQLEAEFLERDRARTREKLMVRELDHRVKNTLATVLAISHQTAQGSQTLGDYADTYHGRIGSLARIHERLAKRRWTGLSIRSLVESTLQPYGAPERTHLDGEELILPPACAMPFAMTLHELVTNAVKYGALSGEAGTVSVTWRTTVRRGAPWVRVEWIERDGPAVVEPLERGFGTSLIRNGIGYELDGRVTLDFVSTGVECRIDFPLEIEEPPQPSPEESRPADGATVAGARTRALSAARSPSRP